MDVDEALERADRMLPAVVSGHTPKAGDAEVDQIIGELAKTEGRLPPGHPLMAMLRARLGCLYAKRYLSGRGAAGDREEGIRLLRAARAGGAAHAGGAAAGLGEDDRLRAAMLLASLVQPMAPPSPGGGLPAFDVLATWVATNPVTGARAQAAMAEGEELLAEVLAAPLPDSLAQQLRQAVESMSALRSVLASGDFRGIAAFFDRFLDLRPGTPGADQLRVLADFVRTAPLPGPSPQPPPEPERPTAGEVERIAAILMVFTETGAPGTIGTDRLREATELLDAQGWAPAGDTESAQALYTGGLGKVLLATRTGDPDLAVAGGEMLKRASESLPPDHPLVAGLRMLLPVLPMSADVTRGNLRDAEVALRALTSLAPEPVRDLAAQRATPDGELLAILRVAQIAMRLTRPDIGAEELDEVTRELHDLAGQADSHDSLYAFVLIQLGSAYLNRARQRGDQEDLRSAVDWFEQVRGNAASPPFVRALLTSFWPLLLATSALLERDPARIAGVTERAQEALRSDEVITDQRAAVHWSTGLALQAAYGQTGDSSQRDEAIAQLEQGRAALSARANPRIGRVLLWRLAESYAERGDRRPAIARGLESLGFVAEDVQMQLGAEHGLQAAQEGADRGLTIAAWAVEEDSVADAVAALEAGRALVLRAAAVSVGVPEQLEALGHRELAEQWRAVPEGQTGEEGARALLAEIDASAAIPSTVRRRALDALRNGGEGKREGQGALLTQPGVPELLAGLAGSGADALVYLIPGQGEASGAALVLEPSGGSVLPLPGLSRAGRGPLEDYLSVAARRQEDEAAWEAALEALCVWAGPAAVGPVLERLQRADSTPPRLVLVPCGNLGVVPWHAARLLTGGYACERAVVSYAASGAQFLDAAARERLPLAARVVLVADPRLELIRAAEEVTSLREACYGGARLYGAFAAEPESSPVCGEGTPGELLAELDGTRDGTPASLVHATVHGRSEARPTVSALLLTAPLTVTRILDRPGGPRAGEPGPLVVLSACETDLSWRDHDEALTLTTAFVARGAADAVGSRWTIREGASALMMAVFHHYLAKESLAPPDALRAAQLWMLDPERKAPPGVRGELLREMNQPRLDRVASWAAFTHQGSPVPSPAPGTAAAR